MEFCVYRKVSEIYQINIKCCMWSRRCVRDCNSTSV